MKLVLAILLIACVYDISAQDPEQGEKIVYFV